MLQARFSEPSDEQGAHHRPLDRLHGQYALPLQLFVRPRPAANGAEAQWGYIPTSARTITAASTIQPKWRPRVARALPIAAEPKTAAAVTTMQRRAPSAATVGVVMSSAPTAIQATTPQCQTARTRRRTRTGRSARAQTLWSRRARRAAAPPKSPTHRRAQARYRASFSLDALDRAPRLR